MPCIQCFWTAVNPRYHVMIVIIITTTTTTIIIIMTIIIIKALSKILVRQRGGVNHSFTVYRHEVWYEKAWRSHLKEGKC